MCFCFYLLIKYLTTVFHIKGRTIFSTEDTDKSGTIMSSKKSQDNKGGRQEQYCIRAASICIPGSKLRPGDTRIGKSQVQTSWCQSPAGRGTLIDRKRADQRILGNGLKDIKYYEEVPAMLWEKSNLVGRGWKGSVEEAPSNLDLRDFPGGPGVKNLPCDAGDSGSVPGQGTKIPQATERLRPHATLERPCTAAEDPASCSEDLVRLS